MQIHLNIFKSRQAKRKEKNTKLAKIDTIYMYVRDKEKKNNNYIVIEKRILGPFIAYFELIILLFLFSFLFFNENNFVLYLFKFSIDSKRVNIKETIFLMDTAHFSFLFSGTFRMASNQNPTKTISCNIIYFYGQNWKKMKK